MQQIIQTTVAFLLFASNSSIMASSMQEVVAEQGAWLNPCAAPLEILANSVFGTKPHRIVAHQHSGNDKDNLFTATTVLQYRDRLSHIYFTATVNNGHCAARYMENYALQFPCVAAREEIFKKWQFVGRLHNSNIVLQSLKQPTQRAFLSPGFNKSGCLISITDYYQAEEKLPANAATP